MLKIRHEPQDCWLVRRRELVRRLQQEGWVVDPNIGHALEIVPWHVFFEDYASAEQVYAGERIETDFMVWSGPPNGALLRRLCLKPKERVLDIGTGTGLPAALMAAVVGNQGTVTTLEINVRTASNASRALERAGGSNVRPHCADGWFGYPDDAPYDAIYVQTGRPGISPYWLEQLADGGRLCAGGFIRRKRAWYLLLSRVENRLLLRVTAVVPHRNLFIHTKRLRHFIRRELSDQPFSFLPGFDNTWKWVEDHYRIYVKTVARLREDKELQKEKQWELYSADNTSVSEPLWHGVSTQIAELAWRTLESWFRQSSYYAKRG